MGADLAEHAETGVNGDIQASLPGSNRHSIPGTDQGADLALDAGPFVQAQVHPLLVHPEGQLDGLSGFPFVDRHFHLKTFPKTPSSIKKSLNK
jgi:hypothetical protein